MRSRLYAVFRLAAVFVALEVADLPILCGDEWSDAASPVSASSVSGYGAGTTLLLAGDSADPGDECCYCPCHMTFAGTGVAAAEELRFAKDAAPDPLALLLVSRPADIEHPPQNLL
jgi:hypothetical protein